MLKLKLQLDPNDQRQMLALANFAATLAGGTPESKTTVLPKQAAPEPKAGVEAPEPKAEAEAPETKAPAKRTRRSKAEIAADKEAEEEENAAILQEARDTAEGEDADSEEAEEVGEQKGKASDIGIDDIRRAVAEKKGRYLKEMKAELSSKFKANTVNELDEKHYLAFFNYVESL